MSTTVTEAKHSLAPRPYDKRHVTQWVKICSMETAEQHEPTQREAAVPLHWLQVHETQRRDANEKIQKEKMVDLGTF